MYSYRWDFSNSTQINTFKNANKYEELYSDKFDNKGCTFYIECSPNGCSYQNSPEGECILWLAIHKLPDNIAAINVSFTLSCDAINYSASHNCVKLGLTQGNNWSAGASPKTHLADYSNLSNWCFKCDITINEMYEKTEDDEKLSELMSILRLLQTPTDKANDDDHDHKDETKPTTYTKYDDTDSDNDFDDDKSEEKPGFSFIGAGGKQKAIQDAKTKGEDKAIYEFNGSKYYIDLNGEAPDDDEKDESSSDISDVEDLINDPHPGFPFVGDGGGQKVDIKFNENQTILALKTEFGHRVQCDPTELEILACVNGEFVPVQYQTLKDNKIKSIKDLIIYKKENKKEAVKRLIRAKKWEDKTFRKEAKSWLKNTGNEGKKGVDNLIKKNGLNPGWNDILSKLNYNDVLKIIKDENIMQNIDRSRVDEDFRKKYGITRDETAKLTYQEISKMHQKTTALRDKFYEDMSIAALKGVSCKINPECTKILDQFDPKDNVQWYGVVSLIDGNELKAMGIPCKNVDSIKKGEIYFYPSTAHNKSIQFKGSSHRNGRVGIKTTGHQELCDLCGIPPEFCGGFAIQPPILKFRSGTCNFKPPKVKGFDNGKALGKTLQRCLKQALTGTKAEKFYNKIVEQ